MNNIGEPYLNQDFFLSIADIGIITPEHAEKFRNGAFNMPNARPLVIFVHTKLLPNCIHYLIHRLHVQYILITACSDDACMPFIYSPCRMPDWINTALQLVNAPFLIKWYTKNLHIPTEYLAAIPRGKMEPIPLGPKFQYTSTDFFGEPKEPVLEVLNTYCLDAQNRFYTGYKPGLLYFHYGDTTAAPFIGEHENIRQKVQRQLLDAGFIENQHEPFAKYMDDLSKHKFAVSPPGRGLDTHRTWEALMVGTVPIVLRSSLDPLFENLPVLIVDDYSVLSVEWLNEKYDELLVRGEYNFEVLYSDYWRNKIRKHF